VKIENRLGDIYCRGSFSNFLLFVKFANISMSLNFTMLSVPRMIFSDKDGDDTEEKKRAAISSSSESEAEESEGNTTHIVFLWHYSLCNIKAYSVLNVTRYVLC
jgi:hypothetical protein